MSCLMSWIMFFETYTAMRLHHPAFPQHVLFSCRTLQRFSLEQRLYTSEGINWSHITWQDTWSTDDTVRHQFTYSFERNSLDTMFVKHLRPPEFLEIPRKELKNLQAFLFSMLQTSSNYNYLAVVKYPYDVNKTYIPYRLNFAQNPDTRQSSQPTVPLRTISISSIRWTRDH